MKKLIIKTFMAFFLPMTLFVILNINSAYAAWGTDKLKEKAVNYIMESISDGEASRVLQEILIEAGENTGVDQVVGIINDDFKDHMTEINAATIIRMIEKSIVRIDEENFWDKGSAIVDEIKNWKDGNLFKEARDEIKDYFMITGKTGYEEEFETRSGKLLISLVNETKLGDSHYSQYYKTQDQLVREAYSAMGFEDVDEEVLNRLFRFHVQKYDDYIESLTDEEKEFINKRELMFGIGMEPTQEAIRFMNTVGGDYHTWNDVFQAYKNYTGQNITTDGLNKLMNDIEKDKKRIEELMNDKDKGLKALTRDTKLEGNVIITDKDFELFAQGLLNGQGGNISQKPGTVYVYSDELNRLLTEFREKYGISYWKTKIAVDPSIIKFVQNGVGEVLTELKLPGVNYEYYPYISKVVFTITRKDGGTIGTVKLADYARRQQVAKERSSVSGVKPNHGTVYNNIMGVYVPDTQLVKISSTAYQCSIDFETPIREKYPDSYHDILRRDYSSRFDYRNFMPTLSLSKDTDPGVYEVRVQMYATAYSQIDAEFSYEVPEYKDPENPKKVTGYRTEYGRYFPHRQKPDGTSKPKTHYSNYPPYSKYQYDVGEVIWEINVGKGVETDLPPYGQGTFKIKNFITK